LVVRSLAYLGLLRVEKWCVDKAFLKIHSKLPLQTKKPEYNCVSNLGFDFKAIKVPQYFRAL
jgi:hypothetical protein